MNRGLTRVEVLVIVVIAVIALLLFLPPIIISREAARRTQCMNNQKELTLALLNYEAKHKRFPSMRNPLGPQKTAVGWVPMLLPYQDRADLWNIWEAGTQATDGQGYKYMKVMVCPSDPPSSTSATDTPCAYTMNGLVCRDLVGKLPPVGLDYINQRDGAASTLLLSENLRVDNYSASNVNGWTEIAMPQVKYDSTFGCPFSPKASPLYVAFCNATYPYVRAMSPANTSGSCLNLNSNHGGGVVVAYCDGHVGFLTAEAGSTTPWRDDTLTIYDALVTPDGCLFGEGNVDGDDDL